MNKQIEILRIFHIERFDCVCFTKYFVISALSIQYFWNFTSVYHLRFWGFAKNTNNSNTMFHTCPQSTTSASSSTQPMQAELVKHPLQHEWTLWYYEPDKSKKWEENLNLVSTFSTVEDFWSLFTHIKQPTEVKVGSDYSLFKDGIRPMWEDQRNRDGGVWRITLQQRQRGELDRYWIDTVSRLWTYLHPANVLNRIFLTFKVLCLIGEAFDNYDDVCGATVNIRPKGDRICVWTADCTNEDAVMEIGRKLKAGLTLNERFKICYSPHTESMNRGSSTMKFMYEV